MAGDMEKRRFRSLIRRYSILVERLRAEGALYTDGLDCVFCSGEEGYRSSSDSDNDEVKHSRRCPTHQADRLFGQAVDLLAH